MQNYFMNFSNKGTFFKSERGCGMKEDLIRI